MRGIFQKENAHTARKYGIYRHLPTYEKIIRNLVSFYSEKRPQDRYNCKTPLEVRQEGLASDNPTEYPIPENKRINKYKEKWCA